ncbi:AraC family transcriptional regulator [Leptolyngbya sp. 7M]|uniref:AraC family transcriptional regulator n=1 Tax=Leptolyngbya sp. 7M TaxID=2812896 RepID=UPI001CED98C0|nr:AraC family transcriptional regulator [Leptolyngbya sp. 7M]
MTLILNQSDWDELHQQAPITCPDNLVLDEFEKLKGIPEILGRGYSRGMELSPGVWLNFCDCEYHRDFIHKTPDHDHPIQISIFPSCRFDCDIHPGLGGSRSYFSGSGISPGYVERYRSGQRLTCINVEILPDLLDSFLINDRQRQSEPVKQLFKGEDWKVAFYPTVTPAIRSIAQQMWDAPYRGELKRMYLQAKVMELLVIYLDLISDNSEQSHVQGLKPETIERLHHAKNILDTQLENPPSILELAQQVGVSDRTLQRGGLYGFQQAKPTNAIAMPTRPYFTFLKAVVRC